MISKDSQTFVKSTHTVQTQVDPSLIEARLELDDALSDMMIIHHDHIKLLPP